MENHAYLADGMSVQVPLAEIRLDDGAALIVNDCAQRNAFVEHKLAIAVELK